MYVYRVYYAEKCIIILSSSSRRDLKSFDWHTKTKKKTISFFIRISDQIVDYDKLHASKMVIHRGECILCMCDHTSSPLSSAMKHCSYIMLPVTAKSSRNDIIECVFLTQQTPSFVWSAPLCSSGKIHEIWIAQWSVFVHTHTHACTGKQSHTHIIRK